MASEKAKHKKNPLVNYLQASFEELRKVTWPTRNQAIRLTFLVLGFCMVVAILLGILDFVFGIGYRSLLDLGPERSLPTGIEEADSSTTMPLEGSPITVTTEDGREIEVNMGEEATVGEEGVEVTPVNIVSEDDSAVTEDVSSSVSAEETVETTPVE